MMDALIPSEQKQVLFYEDEITAVRLQDSRVFVPIRPICEQMGLAWNGQFERIKRDPVLSEVAISVRITRTNIDPSSKQPHTSDMICLPLSFLNGWLFGIQANRVKAEIRERLIAYQKECYQVLHEAFEDGRLRSSSQIDMEALAEAGNASAQAYVMARAIMRLSYQQVALEQRLQAYQGETAQRLEALETAVFDPTRHISEAQAMEISQAVKTVALLLSKQTRRNEYGGVYGELYRRYSITSYKQLPANQFELALNWLNEWREQLESDTF